MRKRESSVHGTEKLQARSGSRSSLIQGPGLPCIAHVFISIGSLQQTACPSTVAGWCQLFSPHPSLEMAMQRRPPAPSTPSSVGGHYTLFLSLPLKSAHALLLQCSSGIGDRAIATEPWRQSRGTVLVSLGGQQMDVSGKLQHPQCHTTHPISGATRFDFF